MVKKEIKPEDVKTEDIAKEIEKSLYGVDNSGQKAFAKLATFFMLFLFYLYASVNITNYTTKLMVIILGLVFLIFLFQGIVLPGFNQRKKRKTILEP